MRIVGGKLKGRRFDPPIKNWDTRPTTDYAKEALFNILENEFDMSDLRVIDLFAGTGNITFEFLSRGARHVTAVEKFGPAIKLILSLASEWGLLDSINVKKADVRRFLNTSNETAEIIFADPPYGISWINELPEMIFNSRVSSDLRLLVIEHDQTTDYSSEDHFEALRKYGQSRFSFFRIQDQLG